MTLLPTAARATPLLNTIARSNVGGALQFYRTIRRSVYPPPRGQQNPKNKITTKKTLGPWALRERKESAAPAANSKSPNRAERRGRSSDRDSRRPAAKLEKPDRRSTRGGRESRGSVADKKPSWKERPSERDSRKRSAERGDSFKSRSLDRRDRDSYSIDRDASSKSRTTDRGRSSRSTWDDSESREPFFEGDKEFSSGTRRYVPPPTAEDSPFTFGEEQYQQGERPWGPRREIVRTHPDSEFIYGTSVVEAALKSGRRDLYKLYVYCGANRQPETLVRDAQMKRLARSARVSIMDEHDIGLLDSMANSRPHNGYVLECSPLHKTPILSLLPVTKPGEAITLQIAQHDRTQPDIVLNSLSPTVTNPDTDRYPLILMLDSILDPGNLGAILRSAYYLGASAVMFSSTHSAPLSPVCLKASAGAAEFIPVLTYKNPVRMIEMSIASGWQFYAAVAASPSPSPSSASGASWGGGGGGGGKVTRIDSMEIKQALMKKPTVVVVGAEGQGLSSPVKRACDKMVTINQVRGWEMGLDSLNVSVAAALLCQGFLARHFGRNVGSEDRLF